MTLQSASGVLTVSHACRACGHATEEFLAFGALPLANAIVAVGAGDEERFPLTMTFCAHCGLVQIAETVNPDKLFRHYVYMSSNSPAFLAHARALSQRLIAERSLDAGSLVVEVASNDGYLLRTYREAGLPVLGIEPARNIAEIARAKGVDTLAEFFTSELARRLQAEGRLADVIHAHNVLAHVPDLTGFVAGLATILKPDGVVLIEVPYLRTLIDRLAFDTVYHEHLCYFSLTPLVALFAAAGLDIYRVEEVAVHGGSLRLFAQHAGKGRPEPSVGAMLAAEQRAGLMDASVYRRFGATVAAYRPTLSAFLRSIRAGGRSIAAYGASAKGATLLNYCGVDRALVDFVVDRSTLKQGFAMPGVRIPILATEELLRRRPDFVLLLAWNFVDEIVAQQTEYLRLGGAFVVPVPTPKILDVVDQRRRVPHPE